MAVKSYPTFGGKSGPATLSFPLISPDSGAAGQEPFRFASGGGIHGNSSGGVALSVAAGDAVTADAQANVSLPQKLTVQKLAMLSGGVRSPMANVDALTVTGDASLGGNLGIGGSAQITGDLTARKITASSDLSAANVSSPGRISGNALTVTGPANIQSLTVTGTFKVSGLENEGAYYFPDSDPSNPGVALGSEHGTGLFATPGLLGLTVAGQSVLSFGAGRRADFAAGLTATAGSFTDQITTAALTASGPAALQGITGTTLTLSGAAEVGGALRVKGNLTVDGMARLADLRIDELSTDHDLTVGEDATIVGNLTCQGSTALQGGLSVGGAAAFGPVSGQRFDLGTIFQLGGDDTHPAVLKVPVPNQAATTDYSLVVGAGGYLSMSADLFVGGTARVRGTTTLLAALTGTAAAFSGALTATGGLTTAAALTAAKSVVGGSTFQTVRGTPGGQLVGAVGDLSVNLDTGIFYAKISAAGTANGWVALSTSASAAAYPLQAPATSPADGPSYAFATSSGDGMGSEQAGSLYWSIDHQQMASLTAQDGLYADQLGAFQFSAANGSVRSLQANQLDVAGPLTAGRATFSDILTAPSATVQGSLSALATSVTSLAASADSSFGGAVAVQGDLTGQGAVAGSRLRAGSASLSSGSGDPNGAVAGSVGDLRVQTDTAGLWQKVDTSANTGWLKVGGSGSGSFPLAAPLSANLAAPSYGFQGSQMGLTDQGANVLVAVTSGAVGWKLDAAGKFSLTGDLVVAGGTTLATTSTAALTAASVATGALTASGATSLQGLTAKAITAQSLTTTTGSVQSAQDVAAAGSLTGGLVVSNGSTWRAGSGLPGNATGAAGDLASVQSGGSPLAVRTASAWRYVALVGDPAPSQFPLLAPADGAGAPSFATAQSPNTGMYFPGPNRIAWSTNGVSAGSIDANQNWSLAGALAAGAATFSGLVVNGTSNLTGNTSIGGTLQVAGAATFTAQITAKSASISEALNAGSGSFSGALSAATATTSGDVVIGGNLTVQGTTVQAGTQRAGYYQTSDGLLSGPAYAFTNEPGLGMWRPGAGNLAFAANAANLLSLAAAAAVFSGAVRVGATNAGLTSPATNTLALQTGGTTALSLASNQAASFSSTVLAPGGTPSAVAYGVGNSTFGFFGYNNAGTLVPAVSQGGVTTTTFFRGVANNNYVVFGIGIGDLANPTPSASGGLGYILGSSTPPNGQYPGTAGSIYCHWADSGTTPAIYVNETPAGTSSTTTWRRVLTTSSTITPTFPVVGPAGSAASPTFQAAAGNGLYSGTDGIGRAILGLAQGGSSVARLATFTNNSLPVWLLGLGDAASTSISGGLLASAQAPATGAPAALPSMVYQYLGGGPGQALWVNESTGTTPSWARVLTSSSQVSASFPLLASPDGTSSAPAYAWASETGLGWYRSAAGTMVAVASGNPLATLAANLVTLPGALRVGGTNAGLSSPGANQLALQVAGNAALSLAASGVATFGFQAVGISGTAALPGLAVGGTSSGLWAGSDAFSTPVVAVSVTGSSIGLFKSTTAASLPVFIMGLGSPASSTVNGGLMVSAQAPQGSVGAFPSQLFQDTRGGSGCLYVYEGTANGTSAWARILTTSTPTPTLQLAQGSAPAAVAGQTRLWADTAGNLGVVSSQGSAAGQTQYVRLDGQATVLTGNLTLTAGMSGATLVASATTGYTVTLPASTSYDLRFYFQVENASGLTVAAASGQLINIGGTVSTAGGTASTTLVGATLELFLRANTGTWFARSSLGSFTLA